MQQFTQQRGEGELRGSAGNSKGPCGLWHNIDLCQGSNKALVDTFTVYTESVIVAQSVHALLVCRRQNANVGIL